MLNFKNKSIILSSLVASILLVGCGSSDATQTSDIQGQLIDSYVKGATYSCNDGTTGITGTNGEFTCQTLPVEFQVGGLRLGSINILASDKHVFPQDLLGLDRNDTNNSEVIAMAQLLQSLDSDNNPENGIDVGDVNGMDGVEEFDSINLDSYIANANVELVDATKAHEHLDKSRQTIDDIDNIGLPLDVEQSLTTISYELTEEVKNDLAYMGNEERLAFDVYNKLYTLYPTVTQFTNIASRSEIKHIETVRALITKYDINGTALSITDIDTTVLSPDADVTNVNVAGVYDISTIQNLYDVLMEKGALSNVDALQVACMVEVTDINDLDKYIINAETSNALDVVGAFNFLRDGSYSHYWAFDGALKTLGVTDGCCSAGTEFCKTATEYPQTESGNGDFQGTQDGNGFHGGRN